MTKLIRSARRSSAGVDSRNVGFAIGPSAARGRFTYCQAAPSAMNTEWISRDRRSIFSAHEVGGRMPGSESNRNRSDHDTSGRNSSWSYSVITISIVRIA